MWYVAFVLFEIAMTGIGVYLIATSKGDDNRPGKSLLPDLSPVRIILYAQAYFLFTLIPDEISDTTRYTSPEYLRHLMLQVVRNYDRWPVDYLGRLVGYVHGILVSKGYIVDDVADGHYGDDYHRAYLRTTQRSPYNRLAPQSTPLDEPFPKPCDS